VSDLAVAAHELVRVVWPTVGVLAAAVHLWLGLVWVLWLQFALCHGVEALEGVVGRVVDVEELLEAGDHVFVALANGMWTGSSWIGADDFIVDDIEVVVHLFWSAVRTVVKSDAAVTLGEFEAMSIFVIDWIDTSHDS